MSDQLNLGQIITTPQQRDAIHIAVIPVVAAISLQPGERVGLDRNGEAAPCALGYKYIGVIDPFLQSAVPTKAQCWLYLEPGSITSLRHDWTHPAFADAQPTSPDKAASEQWLRDFCASADCPGYEAVMQGIQGYFSPIEGYGRGYIDGEYLHFSGSDAHGEIPREFWVHAEIVLGKKLPHHAEYFSCSC